MADAQLRPRLPAVNILALNLAGCLSPARARGSTSSAGQVWREPMGFATRLVRTSISSRQCAIGRYDALKGMSEHVICWRHIMRNALLR